MQLVLLGSFPHQAKQTEWENLEMHFSVDDYTLLSVGGC